MFKLLEKDRDNLLIRRVGKRKMECDTSYITGNAVSQLENNLCRDALLEDNAKGRCKMSVFPFLTPLPSGAPYYSVGGTQFVLCCGRRLYLSVIRLLRVHLHVQAPLPQLKLYNAMQ